MADGDAAGRRALDAYLLDDPDPSVVAPPLETLAPLLPLEQLLWQDFERLCVALARSLNPDADVGLYGVQGDDQEGIDLYVGGAGEVLVAQCRKVSTMGPAAIREAVDDFLAGAWADQASSFVLATPQNLTARQRADAVRDQRARLRERHQSLVVWDQERLAELLRGRREVVRRFFGSAWETLFCGAQVSASAPALRRLRPASATFTGRAAELAALAAALDSDQPAAVALHGLSGAGKTEIAARFAEQAADRYELCVWLQAEDHESLATRLGDLACELGLHTADDDPAAGAQALREHLAVRDDWLLVVDGLSDPNPALELLPVRRGGHLLITTQHHGGWRMAGLHPQRVGVLTDPDGADLLQALCGSQDRVHAEQVVARLGGLALAVAQAGGYCDATSTDLVALTRLLDEDPGQVLGRDLPGDGRAVSRLWELSFAAVEQFPHASALLHGLAWLEDRSVPGPLQEALLERAGVRARELPTAREALLRFSLISPLADGVLMHRLVAEALRARSADGLKPAVQALHGALPNDPHGLGRVQMETLLGHARAVAANAVERGAASVELARLMQVAGDHLIIFARPAEARALLTDALAVLERIGADPVDRVAVLNDHAVALRDEGELAHAEAAFSVVLHLKEQIAGPNGALLISTLTNLAVVQRRRDDLTGALSTIARALAIAESLSPPDEASIAQLLSNRAAVLLDDHRPDDARGDVRRALAIFEARHPPAPAEVAMSYANLANVELDRGDAEAAVAHNRRALKLKRELYGDAHPTVADTLGNLANALQRDGRLTEAEARLREAIAIDERCAHPDRLGVAKHRAALGTVLVEAGEIDEGLALQRAALSGVEALLGADHRLTRQMRANLEESERRAEQVT